MDQIEMKKLREEIDLLFIDIVSEYDGAVLTNDEVSDYTNKVLEKIEKRIESRIQDIEENPFAESDEVIAELENIKKELLK